jgi:hypothetical protein
MTQLATGTERGAEGAARAWLRLSAVGRRPRPAARPAAAPEVYAKGLTPSLPRRPRRRND